MLSSRAVLTGIVGPMSPRAPSELIEDRALQLGVDASEAIESVRRGFRQIVTASSSE